MGIPSNLTLEDLVIPKFCPILGIELEVGGKDSSPSIDRIFPQLGYVKGNVQIISMRANRIKADSTPDELKKVADYMQRITCQNS
jgi:hypothetical protein